MKKLLLMAGLLGFTCNPAMAMTQPDDLVRIRYDTEHYAKKWKDVKLDSATMTSLLARNQKLDSLEQKFHIVNLLLSDDKLLGVLFLGESGTVVMMSWPPGGNDYSVCSLSLESEMGFAAGLDPSCYGIGFRAPGGKARE